MSPNLSPGRGQGCFLGAPIFPSLKLNLPSAVDLLSHPQVPHLSATFLSISALAKGGSRPRVGHCPSDTGQAVLEVPPRGLQGPASPEDHREEKSSPRVGPHKRPPHSTTPPWPPSFCLLVQGPEGQPCIPGAHTQPAGGPIRILWFS